MNSHPKDARFTAYLAEAALARKDYAAAEKLYQNVLKLQPESALALNNMAWVTLQLKKDGALEYAQKADQLMPNQPQIMDTLATVLSAKGETAKAIELQTKAVALQPGNNALKLNLARLYIAAGDKARARTELDALAKLGETNPVSQEATALLKVL
jgi:FimV-like protein